MKDYSTLILGCTGCPTGIAHTYMAQEALVKAAKDFNFDIKVETHGTIGVLNEFTQEEIDAAEVIIVFADKDVNAKRFKGKKVFDLSIGQGIKNAGNIMEEAIKYVEQLDVTDKKVDARKEEKKAVKHQRSAGQQIYKHLMNGVSHMLPFVVAGGILIAVSFLWGITSFDPTDPTYNETAALLFNIGQVAFGLMIPVLAGFIAQSIASTPGLVVGFVSGMIAVSGGTGFLGGLVGGFIGGYIVLLLEKLFSKLPKVLDGMKAIFLLPVFGVLVTGAIMMFLVNPMTAVNNGMINFLTGFQNSNPIVLGLIVGCMSAFDMGGPVNKAVAVTSWALLADGNYYFIAGFSAACIAPPLITAISVLLFKDYYSKEEFNAGIVNIPLGFTHITEGAIPFVASNPLFNMPIMMLGSSLAAILTYLFKVQVPAPHGGFLVLPIVVNPLLWILAILIGSVVGGVLLGLAQKRHYLKKEML